MTKARTLLELFSDFDHDYSFVGKGVAGHPIGQLTLDGGVGSVEIELPLDDIDPDSHQVIIPLNFSYDEEDFTTHLKMEVEKYLAADDGNLAVLSKEGKNRVMEYLNSNKAKLERAFEDFIYDEIKKAKED